MTDQKEFVQQIIARLDQACIPYMLSGSFGSSFHGRPRSTNDADLVIDPNPSQLQAFLDALGPDIYVSREAAFQALQNRLMFNLIDIRSGWKADLIVRKDRAYSREEFARKQKAQALGLETWIVSAEDAVLSKLEWCHGRQSNLQWADAAGVLQVQQDNLDFAYLRKWAKELGLQEDLEKLISAARNTDTESA